MTAMFATTLGVLAGVLAIAQYGPYIGDILKGKTRPHAFSWFVWGLPTGVVFAAQLVEGGGVGAWVTGITALMCTGIFVLALFKGERHFLVFDWVCLALCAIALVLWTLTRDPLGAVVLSTAADLIGFGPTVRKSWSRPQEETLNTYTISGFKWSLSIAALAVLDPTTLIYPIAMVIANWSFAVFLAHRRSRRAAVL